MNEGGVLDDVKLHHPPLPTTFTTILHAEATSAQARLFVGADSSNYYDTLHTASSTVPLFIEALPTATLPRRGRCHEERRTGSA